MCEGQVDGQEDEGHFVWSMLQPPVEPWRGGKRQSVISQNGQGRTWSLARDGLQDGGCPLEHEDWVPGVTLSKLRALRKADLQGGEGKAGLVG